MADNSAHGDFQVPPLLAGRYETLDELGRGGMGIVYRCRDQQTDKRYAVKFLTENRLHDKMEMRRFRHEAKVLTMLRHPNIIRVVDYGLEGKFPYLVSELCVRRDNRPASLEDLQQDNAQRQVEPELLVALMPPIIAALAALHSKGLIHRDIKPSNILLQERDGGKLIPKLSDFGLVAITGDDAMREMMEFSMSIEQESTTNRSLVGTYSYMSPEQKRGDVLDARSDVYSLGLMLYRLATGYERVSFLLPSEVVPALPGWIDDIVKHAVEQDKEQRVASAEALLVYVPEASRPKVIRDPLLHRPPLKADHDPFEPPRPLIRPWVVGLSVFSAGGVLAILIAGSMWLISRPPPPPPPLTVAELLHSRNHEQVMAGLEQLDTSTFAGQDLLPRLRGILLRDPQQRQAALPLICALSQRDPRVRPLLLQIMGQTPERSTTRVILEAAASWDTAPDDAAPAVHDAFLSLPPGDKELATRVLARLDLPPTPRYLPYFLYSGQLDLAQPLAEANPEALTTALLTGDEGVWQPAVDLLTEMPDPAPIIEQLIEALTDSKETSRLRAEVGLIALQEETAPILSRQLTGDPVYDQPILAVLDDIEMPESPAFSRYFLIRDDHESLASLGPAAIPELTAALREDALLPAALDAIQRLDADSNDVPAILIDLLRDDDLDNDLPALLALEVQADQLSQQEVQAVLPELLPLVQAEQPEVADRAAAILNLLEVQVSFESWPYFRYVLRHDSELAARQRALTALGDLAEDIADARQLLIGTIRQAPASTEARTAANALGRAGSMAVPAVQAMIQSSEPALRQRGLQAAAALGEAGAPLVRNLIPLLAQPAERPAAATALGAMGEAPIGPAVEALSRPTLREGALLVLAQLGEPAVFALRERLADEAAPIREQALSALIALGPTAATAVPDLRQALEQPARYPQLRVMAALAAIGPPAEAAIRELRPLANSTSTEIRGAALDTLASLGEPGLTALAELLQESAPENRGEILDHLINPDADSRPDLQLLIDSYREMQESSRRAAILEAIGRYGQAGEPALPLLVEALNSGTTSIRHHAALALGALQLPRPEVIAQLRELENDPEYMVRSAVEEALARLNGVAQQE